MVIFKAAESARAKEGVQRLAPKFKARGLRRVSSGCQRLHQGKLRREAPEVSSPARQRGVRERPQGRPEGRPTVGAEIQSARAKEGVQRLSTVAPRQAEARSAGSE